MKYNLSVLFLGIFFFTSCAPAIFTFESDDGSGKFVNVIGRWLGECELINLRTSSEKYGSNNVEVTQEIKNSLQMSLEAKLNKGEAEKEIIGTITHIIPNQEGKYNYLTFTNVKLYGVPKKAIFEYSNQIRNDSDKIRIEGEFENNIFKGKIFIERSYRSTTFYPNGSSTVEQNKNFLVYSVVLKK